MSFKVSNKIIKELHDSGYELVESCDRNICGNISTFYKLKHGEVIYPTMFGCEDYGARTIEMHYKSGGIENIIDLMTNNSYKLPI